MTDYRVGKRSVTHGKTRESLDYEWKTTEIPDDAEFIDVEYTEPVGMGEPAVRAEIYYLLPMEDDNDDSG